MNLRGAAQRALAGQIGFDTDMIVTAPIANRFARDGYRFCIRYIPHKDQGYTDHDLSAEEANAILDSGMALMVVQHVRKEDWEISAGLGKYDGELAGRRAKEIGIPQSEDEQHQINIWCDLEGIKEDTPTSLVVDYCNEWATAVRELKYLPGLYVGWRSLLLEDDLRNVGFSYFWRGQSKVPNVAMGYQLIQIFPELQINGLKIDIDITQTGEHSGLTASWLTR